MISFPVDLHTHTVASGHAYSTVGELAAAAAAAGERAIAITDHGPGLPNGPHLFHFTNLYRLHDFCGPCLLLTGVEDDLAGPDGSVYMPEKALAHLDVVLIGMHPYGWASGKSGAEITRSLLKAMENPLIKGVAHPVNAWFDLDVKEIVKAAKPTGTAVELNMTKTTGLETRLHQFVEWVEEFDAPLMVNTDAHIAHEIGRWGAAEQFLAGVSPTRILNRNLSVVVEFFNIRHPNVRKAAQAGEPQS